jgi:16S rRNA (guanine527-N7)-methyltransferase
VQFLELVRTLGVGVNLVNGRAEEWPTIPLTAALTDAWRAPSLLRVLAELALPFLCVGGHLAAPKGSGAPREVREAANALEVCGGEVTAIRPLDVESPGPVPTLVLIRKTRETPDNYPRRAGIPAKRPL